MREVETVQLLVCVRVVFNGCSPRGHLFADVFHFDDNDGNDDWEGGGGGEGGGRVEDDNDDHCYDNDTKKTNSKKLK